MPHRINEVIIDRVLASMLPLFPEARYPTIEQTLRKLRTLWLLKMAEEGMVSADKAALAATLSSMVAARETVVVDYESSDEEAPKEPEAKRAEVRRAAPGRAGRQRRALDGGAPDDGSQFIVPRTIPPSANVVIGKLTMTDAVSIGGLESLNADRNGFYISNGYMLINGSVGYFHRLTLTYRDRPRTTREPPEPPQGSDAPVSESQEKAQSLAAPE